MYYFFYFLSRSNIINSLLVQIISLYYCLSSVPQLNHAGLIYIAIFLYSLYSYFSSLNFILLSMSVKPRVYVNPYAGYNPEPQPYLTSYNQSLLQGQPQSTTSLRYTQPVNRNSATLDQRPKLSFPTSNFSSIPNTKQLPSFSTTNNSVIGSDGKMESTGNEQKLKYKQVSQDLAKLKKKLQDIVITSNNQPRNKSLDRYYTPYSRDNDVKVERVYARVVPRPGGPTSTAQSSNQSFSKPVQTKASKEEQKKSEQRVYLGSHRNIQERAQPKTQISIEPKSLPIIEPQIQVRHDRNERKAQNVMIPETKRIQTQPNQTQSYVNRNVNIYNRYPPNLTLQLQKKQSPSLQTEPSLTSTSSYSNKTIQLKNQNISTFNQSNNNHSSYYYNTPSSQTSANLNSKSSQDQQKQKLEFQNRIEKLNAQKQLLVQEKEQLRVALEKQETRNKVLENRYQNVFEDHQQSKKKQDSYRLRISQLERELINFKNRGRNSFEEVLRDQLEQSRKVKQMMEEKNDQIVRLNQAVVQNRRKTEQVINDANIQRLKYRTEKKQLEQLQQIIVLNKDNEIKTLRHALQTAESRLQVAIKDNKAKDQFMQQHLVGRLKQGTQKEYVFRFLQKYEISFPVNNLKQKLLEQQKQIRRLNEIIQRMQQER